MSSIVNKITNSYKKRLVSCKLATMFFISDFQKKTQGFSKKLSKVLGKSDTYVDDLLNKFKRNISKNPYYNGIKSKKLKEGVKALNLDYLPVCKAPYIVMNFDVSGNVTSCCYSREYVLGNFYETSLHDIWFNNPKREKLLEDTTKYKLNTKACYLCDRYIKYQNNNILITMYEKQCEFSSDKYPTRMDFEFSNICNYECMMCAGKWSSSIRKNREKMPPLKLPVNDTFLDELDEYIPHLKFASFLGGEPFLSHHYFKIWDKMAKLNKNLTISVITNGSIYNEKVQKLFDTFDNLTLVVSLDSLKSDVYAQIRKNGNLENVLNNIRIFKEQGKLVWINTCAMIQNIYEVPDLLEFCHNYDVCITFIPVDDALGGTIKGVHENGELEGVWDGNQREPMQNLCDEIIPEFRLKTLPLSELENILKMIEKTAEEKKDVYKSYLLESLDALKHQIIGYIKDKTKI